MPAAPGRGYAAHMKQHSGHTATQRPVLTRHRGLSRAKALRRIASLLNSESGISSSVVALMSRLCLHADELTEAGVPYEMVRALETRYPQLLSQD